MRALKCVTVLCLSVTLALAASPVSALAFADFANPSTEVVRLTPDELASTFGGQSTSEGVITTVGDIAGYGSGVGVAGTVNAGMATASIGSTVLTTMSGVGALVSAYNISEYLFDTVGVQIANDVYITLGTLGVADSGRVIGTLWALSDLVYLSDLTINTEVVGWVDDWYCGGVGCLCDSEYDCDSGLYCVDGYCQDTDFPPI
jgi:hypothetical protein